MSRDDFPPVGSKLPSLHEVLGDVLDQRPASRAESESSRRSHPSSSTSSNRYSSVSPSTANYRFRGTHSTTTSSSSSSHGPSTHYYPSSSRGQSSYVPPPQPHSHLTTNAPGHSYHLFNFVPNEGLVHQKSSNRDDLDPTMPKPRLPPSDPARKYVCQECGNRFSKQSTLRNHHLTHTGERPFACSYPGCGRRFSMACNMQRHMRTHTNASAFEIEEEDWHSSSRGGSTSREGSLARGASQERRY